MTIRRIRIELFEQSRDGETEIVLLTNLTKKKVSATTCCELYRERWRIETAFLEMTECLCCEVNTLAYPRAAIFVFCLAVLCYNAVSIVKAAIAAVHGREADDDISWYYAYTETCQVWRGMEIALPFEFWAEKFDNMTTNQLAEHLKSLSKKIDINKFKKNKRGKRKKTIKKYDPNVNHVSTFQIINKRKINPP